MAITNLDQLVAGFNPPEFFLKATGSPEGAGTMHSLLYALGIPGAGVAPTSGLNGESLAFYAGQLPIKAPLVGQSKYIARVALIPSVNCGFALNDRLWHNSGINMTTLTEQVIDSVVFPARDANGSSAGQGVMVALEVSTDTGNLAPITDTTIRYTSSSGVPNRVGFYDPSYTFPTTALRGTFVPFILQAGDTGVRSVQGLTLGTSYVSGIMHLVAYRPVALIAVAIANITAYEDAVSLGLPRLYTDPVLFAVVHPTSASAFKVQGLIVLATG